MPSLLIARAAPAVALLALALACNSSSEPDIGSLKVSVTTTGANLDPDGYTVSVEDRSGEAIGINGSGVTAGVLMQGNNVDSGGGDIDVNGDATLGTGVDLTGAQLIGGAGDISVFGYSGLGIGVDLSAQSRISTTTGAIG